MKRIFLLLLFAGAVSLHAAPPSGVGLSNRGPLTIDRSRFEVKLFTPKWRSYGYNIVRNEYKTLDRFGGKLEAEGIQGSFDQKITDLGDGKFRLEAEYRFSPPCNTGSIRGILSLPLDLRKVTVDGQTVALPEEPGKTLFSAPAGRPHEITVIYHPSGGQLKISTENSIAIVDVRQYKLNQYNMEFGFSPASGSITESKLVLNFEYRKVTMTPVDISGAVNRSFTDTDKYENWTGQGPENDMHMIPAGMLKKPPFVFDILPPTRKSVIVLGSSKRAEFAREATLNLPGDLSGGALNLLHACAWPPLGGEKLGEIEVTFRNGEKQHIPVRQLVDCDNWHAPQNRANAGVVYEFQKIQNTIGLYGSSFPLKRNDPANLRFKNTGANVVWMIGAVSLSDIPVVNNAKAGSEVTSRAGKDYLPVEFKSEIVPGSALDFSWVSDPPAGKYGFVQASPQGHLVFEQKPEKRIRLIGANLALSANFLEKAACDKLASEMRRQGYNAVRLHHIDRELGTPGDTTRLKPEMLDKLDYLIAAFKKQGIYITLDLHSRRRIGFSVALEEAGMKNWKEYAKNLMTHKNPYTGLTYAEEPAIFGIDLLNENNLIWSWRGAMETCVKLFNEWQAKHGLSGEKAVNSNPNFRRFLSEMEVRAVREEIRFCREELGMRMLLSGLAIGASEYPGEAIARSELDIVDNHVYFDHPRYPETMWKLPEAHTQENPIKKLNSIPCYIAPTRIVGKPFMITEYAYCYPNRYRSAGGAMMGAYSALQDYDALFYFDWAPHRGLVSPGRMFGFDIAGDPIARMSQKLLASMFVREDVAASKEKIAVKIDDDFFQKNGSRGFSGEYQLLSRIVGIGSYLPPLPEGAVPIELNQDSDPGALPGRIGAAWRNFLKNKAAISSTGEILLDANRGHFRAVAPRTEVFALDSGALNGNFLAVSKVSTFSTIGAISLDGKALTRSEEILLLHLTDMINSGEVSNKDRTLIKKDGKVPLLARRGSAKVRLSTAREFRVTALSADGRELGEACGKIEGGCFVFNVDNAAFPGVPAAYHLRAK